MSLISIIQRYKKPVSLALGFSRYRYILLNQESRIRVSGTTLLREFSFRIAGRPLFTSFLPAVSSYKFVYRPTLKSHSLFTSAHYCNLDLQLNVTNKRTMPEKKPFERLPSTVTPKRYKLFFKPDLQKFSFDGKETVLVTVSYLYIFKL